MTRKIVFISVLVSQALVLSFVESFIPVPLTVPGIKLGLANIVTVIAIVFFGFKEAVMVTLLRTIIYSFFAGSPFSLVFSLSGSLSSTLVMAFLYRRLSNKLSLTGISIVGAVFHSVGQLTAAFIVMKELAVLAYLPVLLALSIFTGAFTGIVSGMLVKPLSGIIKRQ